MPDSVNTSDEDIKPFNDEGTAAPVNSPVVTPPGASGYADSTTETPVTADSPAFNNTNTAVDTSTETELTPLLRTVPDSVVEARKKDPDFRYANDPSVWDTVEEKSNNNNGFPSLEKFLSSKGFKYFIYIFLGALLLFALYKIVAENNLFLFYRRPSRIRGTPVEEAALPEEDLDQLLRKAIEEKAFRPAVRYYYLKTLRMLEQRQLINWHIKTTNEEYARQMDHLPQGGTFRWLMGAYERVWYGKFQLNEAQFTRLSQHFQDFHNSIGQSRRA